MNALKRNPGRIKRFSLILAFSIFALPFCHLNAQSGFFFDRTIFEEFADEVVIDEKMFYDEPALFRNFRNDYLVALDTFKSYSIINDELTLTSMGIYGFDENYLLSSNMAWGFFPAFGELRPFVQNLFNYDESGILVSDTAYFYNWDQQNWLIVAYRDFEYDENGTLIRTSRFSWDQDEETWRPFSIIENEVENGEIVRESIFEWEESNMDFELNRFTTWEYEDGLLIHEKFYRLDNVTDTFYLDAHDYFEYNDNGLLILHEIHETGSGSQIIEPVERWEYDYNDDNLVNLEVRHEASISLTGYVDWIANDLFEIDYTDFQAQEVYRRYNYHGPNEGWLPLTRELYYYDDYESLITTQIDYVISHNPINWDGLFLFENERDYDFPPNSYLVPSSFNIEGHKVLSETRWNIQAQENIILHREFIYSSLAVNVQDFNEKHPLKIYPNPTAETVYISLEGSDYSGQTLQVVDMLGRIWYREPFSSSLELEVRDWPAGVYKLVLFDSQSGLTSSRQFVKH